MTANISKTDASVLAVSEPRKTDYTYRVAGGRTGVLLIHGLCGTPSEMRYVAHGLARQGYTVHCPQLAGHCGSAEDLKATTWQDWYAGVEAALLELRTTCDEVIVGGLSTGAVLSLLLAADHPDLVQGLILLAPTLWVNGWNIPWTMKLFKLVRLKAVANMMSFADSYPHGIKDERIRKFFADALFSGDQAGAGLAHTPGGAVFEHRRLVDHVLPLVNRIEQPTLILHPRHDDIANIDNSWYLQRTMKGSVELVALEDSYHNVTIDRQRHVVVERAAGFMAGLAKRVPQKAAKAVSQPVNATETSRVIGRGTKAQLAGMLATA